MKWEAVFFDFDGVILDSVNIKTRTFAELFSQYGPEIQRKVVDYHLSNGGVSRYEKFKYYYKNFIQKPISDDELKKLGEHFSEIALNQVLRAEFIPGAKNTIKKLLRIATPAFIVSGTPQEEMDLIVRKRNLSKYFLEVHGSPKKKSEILHDIQSFYDYQLNKCLFVGDAMSDYTAAKETGTNFLGIVSSKCRNTFPKGTNISVDRVHL